MSKRMEIEDASDDEGAGRIAGGSRGDNAAETVQEQAIDENQMINEEYKIWSVTFHNASFLVSCLVLSLISSKTRWYSMNSDTRHC